MYIIIHIEILLNINCKIQTKEGIFLLVCYSYICECVIMYLLLFKNM